MLFNALSRELWTLFPGYPTQRQEAVLKRNSDPNEFPQHGLNVFDGLDFDVHPEPSVSPQEVIDEGEAQGSGRDYGHRCRELLRVRNWDCTKQ